MSNIWRPHGVLWHCPRNIANAAQDISTRMLSYEARFWEAAWEHEYTQSCALCRSWLITDPGCRTHELLPLHIASPANWHIEIGFWQWHGDSFYGSGGIDRQISIFDVISQCKAICVPILLHVSCCWMSVTKLWDMIIRLCMCKGWTHHAKVLESKSACQRANKFNFCLPISDEWESKSYNRDEMYRENSSKWCHTSHRKRGQCPIRICLNDDRDAAFIHASNCITLRTDLVHMVEIFKIAYVMSWKSMRRSWMRKG